MNYLLISVLLLSFLVTLFLMPFWIRKTKQIKLIWSDMNKPKHPKNVAGSGGIVMVCGFVVGVLSYIALNTFYFKSTLNLIEIFAALSSILLVTGIALIDDLFGWQKGGLSKRSRIIMVLISAIPLIVINAGESNMMGIEFGLVFPLVLIPIGILGSVTTYNFLAGFNGLEAGQGIIILTALSLVTYFTGNAWLSVVSLCMVAALLAFYLYNHHPAKVFPGDVLTYPIGAMIAIVAILGNIEKIAIFFFIPYILETGLKLRGGLKKSSFAKPNSDGSLDLNYNKIYGLTHLSIYLLKKVKKKVYERDVAYAIHGFQILIILLGFLILM